MKYVTPTSRANARTPLLSGDTSASDPGVYCPGVVINDEYRLKAFKKVTFPIPEKKEVKSHPVDTYTTCKISLLFSIGIECSSGSVFNALLSLFKCKSFSSRPTVLS